MELTHPGTNGVAPIGVVVALPLECAAVLAVLDGYEAQMPSRVDPNIYYRGVIQVAGRGDYRLVVAQCPKMGNNGSAMVAKDLIRSFGVRHVMMVGIAAGIPNLTDVDKHVRLGDVVVSYGAGVVQYDLAKRHWDGSLQIRSCLPPPSRLLLGAADFIETTRLRGQTSWTRHLHRTGELGQRPADSTDVLYVQRGVRKPRWLRMSHPAGSERSGMPRVHRGLIGSGNSLMKDITERDRLASAVGIAALEMEGAGVADAVWDQTEVADYLVIRGICDYADRHKNDLWQPYAAAVAACYLRAVIETGVVPVE
jgi:nucleoside phosphorylase